MHESEKPWQEAPTQGTQDTRPTPSPRPSSLKQLNLDNIHEVVEVGCWSVRAAVTSWAEWDISVLSVRIWILAALGKHAEGDGGEGGPSTQQSASKSRGHFY